jgi:hypothetical protein
MAELFLHLYGKMARAGYVQLCIIDSRGKFATGVEDGGDEVATRGAPEVVNCDFQKNGLIYNKEFSGARGKMIHEKN